MSHAVSGIQFLPGSRARPGKMSARKHALLKPECALKFVKKATLVAVHPEILRTQTVLSEMGSAVPGPFALAPLRGPVLSFQSKKRKA